MELTENHIILFEKLHKFYTNGEDVVFFKNEYGVDDNRANELANSIGVFRFLADFNSNKDCKSIGFAGKKEMRDFLHKWLIVKKWKGTNISLAHLLRKFKMFKEARNDTERLKIVIKNNAGRKNSLKFNNQHINVLRQSFVPNDFEKTYDNYLLESNKNNLQKVSKSTVYQYYKKEKDSLVKLFNAKNISNLHAQFIQLSDFDVFHKELHCDKKLASELVNSVACLEMLNYENLKLEFKQIGIKTKAEFLEKLLEWLKEKDWYGVNRISNIRTLTRKASVFKQALEENRTSALLILVGKKIGNKNSLKFNNKHKEIVYKLIDSNIYVSKAQCFRDYQEKCKQHNIKPLGIRTVSQFINSQQLFEKYQSKARTYSMPKTIVLTDEQNKILQYDANMKINAVAGSGKTTTLLEYAKTRKENSKILYIAFNKSVKDDAVRKFKTIKNVEVVTAHSLAYKRVVTKENKHLLTGELLPNEIINILKIPIKNKKDRVDAIILTTHIQRFLKYYCNSAALRIADLDYLSVVIDQEAKKYVDKNIKQITDCTVLLFNKMLNGQIRFTHDFYLKAFQLQNPKLEYDYIFFDEGQDASPAMLDVFLKQSAKKVIVGDSNQQIYSWRYAINSLDRINFKEFILSNSFRFDRHIANIAMDILETKKQIGLFKPIVINGIGEQEEIITKATLARTNIKLLELAIKDVFENKTVKSIYFEGHISTYKFGEHNSIMYDILSLYFNKRDKIKHSLIKEFSNIKELITYSKKTENNELSMLISLVIKYKGKLYSFINGLKDIHLTNSKKNEADMIYSTVHKCKGMEYDEVFLADDFYTEERITEAYEENNYNVNRLNEEINLLYVAITRARCKINIPSILIPDQQKIVTIKEVN